MALESLCGFDKKDFLKAKHNQLDDIQDDIVSLTQNFNSNMSLMMPARMDLPELSELKRDYLDPRHSMRPMHALGGPADLMGGWNGYHKSQFESGQKKGSDLKLRMDHGTTTLGFKYNGGVLLAVDSRATGGMFIGSQTVKKIIEINDFLLGTMAGGAADCVYWERVLSKQCRMYELRNRERISVAAASKMFSNMAYQYKGYGLSMGVMIAGWDKKGPGLYYVDDDGRRAKGRCFSVGSGSTYAMGVLDQGYREDMTDEEAQELGRRSIFHATHRDAASGGIIRVYMVKESGWIKISEQDMDSLWDKYQNEKIALRK